MNVLSIENLMKTVNDEPLFSEVSLGLEHNEKVGIVGKNGAGKSTFLKVISGILHPDEGKISKASDADMVMLDQTVSFKEGTTIKEYFYEGQGHRLDILRDSEKALVSGNDKEYQRLLPLLTNLDCYKLEVDFVSLLTDMGLNLPLDTKMEKLSGGEQKKVAIARVFAVKPSIILLDEITNHLDIKTIEYIESYIQNVNAAVILVTHDRYILNSVCSTIWELDRGHFYNHPGSYESYLERRAERIDMEQKEQDRLQNILNRELIWLSRGPQARTGKDKNRKERIMNMLSQRKNVQDVKQVQFSSLERRLGKKILDIEGVGYSYGERTLFKDVTYDFKKGDRIGIVGDNGSGKSTFLDIITGALKQTEGTIDVGINTYFGYYDQLGRNLDTTKTALEYINEIGSRILMGSGEVSSSRFLEIFGFPVSRQRTEVSVFSGGEKRRLYLLSKIARNPNFLVLDEPTNDLDIKTMENLEEYISSFPGCVLIVSHDRAFLDCTCDMLLILEDGKMTLFPGHYSQYKEQKDKIKAEKAENKSDNKKNWKMPREKKGLSFKEKKEFEELEIEISLLEELVSRLEESFATSDVTEDGNLQERTQKYEKAKQEKDEKEERWLYLATKE